MSSKVSAQPLWYSPDDKESVRLRDIATYAGCRVDIWRDAVGLFHLKDLRGYSRVVSTLMIRSRRQLSKLGKGAVSFWQRSNPSPAIPPPKLKMNAALTLQYLESHKTCYVYVHVEPGSEKSLIMALPLYSYEIFSRDQSHSSWLAPRIICSYVRDVIVF